jgi:signal transduction histidine kinase
MYLPIIDPPTRLSRLVEGRPLTVVETQPRETVLKMPPRYGYLAIQLNRSVIDEKILPALTAKYFPDNDYALAINEGDAASSDANARLYELRPENLIMFSNRDIIPRTTGERSIVLNSHVETVSGQWSGNGGEASKYEIKIQSDSKPRTQVFTASSSPDDGPATMLMATHNSGSIDVFMGSKLRRDLAIGLSLLLLTASAVAALIVSSLRAKAAAQRQIDFVSSVSHEFRTPLAVIKSAGENLADGVTREADQVNRYGELIRSEGDKLNAMVEQILEFAGANSGRQKLNLEPTPVADLVNSAIDECRPIAENRGFTIETNVAEGLPEMSVDRVAISQAIRNLITNSIKYSNGERWVRVSASNGNGKVKISVEDRGIGISKSDLKQIFEPFFRAKDVVDAQIHGNGLGLSLVKKTVNAHGGEVTATSEIGKGSRFTISLPLQKI